jgi:D-amino-acid oxidase
MGRPEILVVGAGVTGLTTAIHLAEVGHTVQLIAELPPEESTSASAGASWGPYLVDDPQIMHWIDATRTALGKIATDSGTGVRLMFGLEVSEDPGPPPQWAHTVPDFESCSVADLERVPGRYLSGWRYTIPLIDMDDYLPYLVRRLSLTGTTPEYGRRVTALADLRGAAGIVINCTGLGARHLVPDHSVVPTRGQLVVMENPGLTEFFQDNTHGRDLTYILPHGDRVVLGGCATDHTGFHLLDKATTEAIAEGIVERCTEVEPRLRDCRILDHRVGLRPSRDRVRLETTTDDGFTVVHNYGHGAAGVSMSWGCAEEIGRLIE